MFVVGGIVKTMRGSIGVDGKEEVHIGRYNVETEEQARLAWESEVQLEVSTMSWRVTGVRREELAA